MCILKIRNRGTLLLLLAVLWGLVGLASAADEQYFPFNTQEGARVNVVKSTQMPFVRAELLIYYKDKSVDPLIPYLTYLNIFSRDINKSNTNLLSDLRRLGNDFTVVHRSDYIKFSFNMLKSQLSLFSQFLKELYNINISSYLTLRKFYNSRREFWNLFRKESNWQNNLAHRLAYREIFPDHYLGNSMLDPERLNHINLWQVHQFYRKTYTIRNSQIFIKGDVNPHITLGLIKISFPTAKNQVKPLPRNEPRVVNNQRKVYLIDVRGKTIPDVYWYLAIPPYSKPLDHVPYLVINHNLFGYPAGRIFQGASNIGIRNFWPEFSMTHHLGVSVICNAIRLNPEDIERFIMMADNEQKRLINRGEILRKDYLEAMNFLDGNFKVRSGYFNDKIDILIDQDISNATVKNYLKPMSVYQINLNLNTVNRVLDERIDTEKEDFSMIPNMGVIVIVGDSRLILKEMKRVKPQLFSWSEDNS